MIDKANYPNLFEGVRDKCLIYHNENTCILEFESFERFLETFPNYHVFKKSKPFGKQWKPDGAFFANDKTFLNDDRYKLFRHLEKLDRIFEHISIEKTKCTPNCSSYELFHTRKILVKSSITSKDFEELTDQIFVEIDRLLLELVGVDTTDESQMELNRKFFVKALEEVLIEKARGKTLIITFGDIIKYWDDIVSEYEIIKQAYIESLDTRKIRYDYEKKAQEIMDKLHTMLSDMQTKMMLPPLAVLLAVVNIYDKPGLIKFAAMLIVAGFMGIITYFAMTQRSILQNYTERIKEWQHFYEKQTPKNFEKIQKSFSSGIEVADQIDHRIIGTVYIGWILVLIGSIIVCMINK